jgi:ParB/Sulfiredoxin domain
MPTKAAARSVTTNSILLRGHHIPVTIQNLEQHKLRFYSENPRVYSAVRGGGNVPTQDEIQTRLLEMEHVKDLIQDIRLNKGLIEPLIVRDGTYEVLEGNSRLAAYRFLAKSDPVKWGYVKCTVLPNDIDEALIFILLGQFHIKGKKDWVPYEQAGFLYRRFKKHNAGVKALALEIGISAKRVKHLVDTYEFMVEHGEDGVNRWSYYDEYLKSNKIRRAREQCPELDSLVIEKIRTESIERAVDLREQLPVICSAPKILGKFAAGNLDFSEAYEAAVQAGGDSAHLKTVKKFRDWITRPRVGEDLVECQGKVRGSVIFELRKIESRVRHLLKKLDR